MGGRTGIAGGRVVMFTVCVKTRAERPRIRRAIKKVFILGWDIFKGLLSEILIGEEA